MTRVFTIDLNAPRYSPPLDPEKLFEKIATANKKAVTEVKEDFRTCPFFGELAQRYGIDFAEASWLMRKEQGLLPAAG